MDNQSVPIFYSSVQTVCKPSERKKNIYITRILSFLMSYVSISNTVKFEVRVLDKARSDKRSKKVLELKINVHTVETLLSISTLEEVAHPFRYKNFHAPLKVTFIQKNCIY